MADFIPLAHAVASLPKCPAPSLIPGVPLMTAVISTAIGVVVAAVAGYFVGKHGLAKTQSDLHNLQATLAKDVQHLQAQAKV